MAKAVFTSKISSSYDDLPEERYHFPRTYLSAATAAIGDWIVYYEPRRPSDNPSSTGGRQAYFATARVVDVRPDRRRPDHYYADIADYLEFDRPVPFRENAFYYESGLRKDDGSTNKGRFGRSVRILPEAEYHLILAAGFSAATVVRPVVGEGVRPGEEGLLVVDPVRVPQVTHRPFRDRAFSTAIRRAYDNACAISGLRILNGGGRPEAQAAHIRPVADSGPDSLRNGVALSSTFHWMFDRGLVSIDDDYTLLLKRDSIPDSVLSLVNPDRRLRLPTQAIHHPHPRYLEYHREHVFKG